LAKPRKIFVCTNCGHESPKWEGKCNSCQEWNTFREQTIYPETKQEIKKAGWQSETEAGKKKAAPIRLTDIRLGEVYRIETGDAELDRTLGGGIVPGSLILIGGQPGIGKSTLLLQTSLIMKADILYVSGEESEEQIKMRANRLGGDQSKVMMLAETNVSQVLKTAVQLKPQLMIIDSIQVMSSPHVESTPGSISQVRECAGEILRFAKETNIPVFLIGHITKEGSLAGPKLLEHMVDVVLQFEGDRNYNYRILRTGKNRFGSTDELGIYEMVEKGLRPVSNPSELLLSQNDEVYSGSAVAATLEGQRPMLIEVQTLVSTAVYGTPQRSATGFDLRRLHMVLAVLEKRSGFFYGQKDVFLNIAGGLKIADPALDLAIVASLISSLQNSALPKDICFAGEISLTGEIKSVKSIEQRIKEADRLGFREIYVSASNAKGIASDRYKTRVIPINRIEDLVSALF
jgi:DNA repair protein RadA/Sms